MARHTVIIAFLILGIGRLLAQSATDSLYFHIDDMPDADTYLPAPPDTARLDFFSDFIQWQWGKKMRQDAERGPLANLDSQYGIERTKVIFGNALGCDIDSLTMPATYHLMQKAGNTGALSADKTSHMRKRPFQQMNEHTWGAFDNEEELLNDSAYLSRHTALGWATALILAEMAPQLQDTILKVGYNYGMSRVIAGAHWQSDVDAAMLCASAAVARLHASPQFIEDLQAAKQEYEAYNTLNRKSDAGWPNGRYFLPAFTDTIDKHYYRDVVNYWQAKTERNTPRGDQAIVDADLSDSTLIASFVIAMSADTLVDSIPAITAMVSAAKAAFEETAQELKTSERFRKRPYVKMKEQTLIPDEEDTYLEISSYPSTNAQVGWGLALLFAEIAPSHQDEILKRGYEYGESRIIAGYQFASDVQAGRILASAVVARLHADPDFMALLQSAKAEFSTLSQ